MGTHEHFGQNDARIRQALDYDDTSGAPSSTRAGLLWVPSSGRWAPRDVLLASDYGVANGVAELDGSGLLPASRLPAAAVTTAQRGPIGGVQAQTLAAGTYNLDGTTSSTRRFTLTGDITLNVPTNGVDGQRITFWLGASGAQRTVTFAAGYEVSPLLPSRAIVIASGTWEMIEVECRNGTWRLVQTDQLLFAPSAIGAAQASAGVPAEGAAGATLVKASANSYDTAWQARGVAQLRATSSQTLSAANTYFSVLFAAEDFDDDNGHSTTTNTSRFTAQRPGLYKVAGSVIWVGSQSTTNPQRLVQLARNGTVIPGSRGNDQYVSTGLTQRISPMFVTLTAGQYVELQVSAAASGAQLFGNTTDYGSMMIVEFVG